MTSLFVVILQRKAFFIISLSFFCIACAAQVSGIEKRKSRRFEQNRNVTTLRGGPFLGNIRKRIFENRNVPCYYRLSDDDEKIAKVNVNKTRNIVGRMKIQCAHVEMGEEKQEITQCDTHGCSCSNNAETNPFFALSLNSIKSQD